MVHSFKTTLGKFQISVSERGLYSLNFGKGRFRKIGDQQLTEAQSISCRTIKEIKNYLSGKQTNFDQIPIDWSGLGNFEKRVLKALKKIPWGKTGSYQDLAEKAGRPKAARYVGRILHVNRLPIIIPCHRILPKSGGYGGFAKGVQMKKRLLKLESCSVDTKVGKKQARLTGKKRVL